MRCNESLKSTSLILPSKERIDFLRSLFSSVFFTGPPQVFFGRHTCHMHRPSYLPRYCEIGSVYWGSQITKNLIIKFASEFSLFIFPCKHLHLPQSYTYSPSSAFDVPAIWQIKLNTHTIQQTKLYFYVLKLWSPRVLYVASNILLRTISSSRLIQFTFSRPHFFDIVLQFIPKSLSSRQVSEKFRKW